MAMIIQFYVIKGGSLYVFGNGEDGRLGIKKYKNKSLTTPTICPPFNNINALQVSASNHTLILATNGDVWCCGNGKSGQLGNDETNNLFVPTKLCLDFRVVSVSAGESHSLMLCDNGWVQGFGWNTWGQIGHDALKKVFVPKTIEQLKKYKISHITSGALHSAALTEDGDLFCFGANIYGQCGVGEDKGTRVKIPTKVEMNEKIKFVDCGGSHTLILSSDDSIYSFGNGDFGCLGHGFDADKYTPTLIEALVQRRIKTCAAGGSHSLCVDQEGIIWSFGRNGEGQCGLPKNFRCETNPTPKIIEWFIENNIKVIDCAAGGNQSSVITDDRSLYVFGSNEYGQLGMKNIRNRPVKISLQQNIDMIVKRVSMGNLHTCVICDTV